MNPDPVVAAEVNALVTEWRGKAMTLVLALIASLALPALVLGTFSSGLQWPLTGRMLGVLALVAALLGIWRRDWSLSRRAGLFLLVIYAFAAIQLASTGLAGGGRLGLLAFPLLALILAGSWVGWLAFGTSVLMFVVFIALAAMGMMDGRLIIRDASTEPLFWLIQGVLWLALLTPLMVLLSRFQSLQFGIMCREREARRSNEIAEAERRRLEEAITQISEDEQRRLGSELHDGLCQQLTAALLACTALENELRVHDQPQGDLAGKVRRQLEESIGSAYDIAKGLCPVNLDVESLLPALQRLQVQVQKTAGVVCELRAAGAPSSLDPQATHHLYRIAQEAVHNALKHARCRRLTLELRSDDAGLLLCVQDDGQAAPPTAAARSGGLGTQIMHYRAKAIGGELRIERQDGGGTVVSCRVPPPGRWQQSQRTRSGNNELMATSTNTTEPSALFLVDDHAMVREGLVAVLQQAGFSVCGQAGSVGGSAQPPGAGLGQLGGGGHYAGGRTVGWTWWSGSRRRACLRWCIRCMRTRTRCGKRSLRARSAM